MQRYIDIAYHVFIAMKPKTASHNYRRVSTSFNKDLSNKVSIERQSQIEMRKAATNYKQHSKFMLKQQYANMLYLYIHLHD